MKKLSVIVGLTIQLISILLRGLGFITLGEMLILQSISISLMILKTKDEDI